LEDRKVGKRSRGNHKISSLWTTAKKTARTLAVVRDFL
jgi:hypothetical protein